MNSKTPWLDENGQPLPKDLLIEVSKKWTAEEWENYALSLESSGEELLMTGRMLEIENRAQGSEFFQVFAPDTADPLVQNYLLAALTNLTLKQSQMIDLVVFKGMSFKDAAAVMNIGKSTAYQHYRDALKRLKSFVIIRPDDLSNMREKFSPIDTNTNKDIREVMEMEISRFSSQSQKFLSEE